MRSHFIEVPSLSEFLTLNPVQRQVQSKFQEDPRDEKHFISLIANDNNLAFCIKFAQHEGEFNDLCQRVIFHKHWKNMLVKLYSEHCHKQGIAGHPFAIVRTSLFNQVRGLFYFSKARDVRTLLGEAFSHSEVCFLKAAVEHGSMHATLLYHQHLYQQIEALLADTEHDPNEVDHLYASIIRQCSEMTTVYGSFAYMMTAEAYARYAQTLLARGDHDFHQRHCIRTAYANAITSCERAKTHLAASKHEIAFASFNQGLKASNNFGVDDPDKAKAAIHALLDKPVKDLRIQARSQALAAAIIAHMPKPPAEDKVDAAAAVGASAATEDDIDVDEATTSRSAAAKPS